MNRATGLESFLTELDASLEGGARHRREIVDELAAHFQDVVDAEMPSRRALSRALERFGSPAAVAEEFNAIRRARLHRRTRFGILLAVVVALVGAPSLMTTAAPRGPALFVATSSERARVAHERFELVALDPTSGQIIGVSRDR